MNKPFPFAFTLGAIVIVVLSYLFWDTEEPTQENIVEEEITLRDTYLNELSEITVTENSPGATIGTIIPTDEDTGETFTYTLSGTDAFSFEISGGSLKLKKEISADYETKTSYSVTVSITDSGGNTTSRDYFISVNNLLDVGLIDDERIINAESEPGNWIAHGRTYEEQRFSPLLKINKDSVSDLGLAWYKDMGTNRALEATPIVVDGIMFFTSTWSRVYAVEAKTGKTIWKFDPEVPGEWARKACCDIVNRGVAVYEGKVFFASLDGRLFSLNAETGEKIWEVDTITDRSRAYTITGAPRAAKGKVFIGNGGAEYGVRGYVTAYDTETGKQVWRFFTVPGDPSLEFEDPAMEMAAKTWKGTNWWEFGGGGTVWNSIVYDPDFNNVYLGVGNGSPWTREIRSPGGGDNLFLASIVAVDADTGEYKWHYQTTPEDNWDYTAVQDMALADMEVDGEQKIHFQNNLLQDFQLVFQFLSQRE